MLPFYSKFIGSSVKQIKYRKGSILILFGVYFVINLMKHYFKVSLEPGKTEKIPKIPEIISKFLCSLEKLNLT
jgi:hypothetical protein